MNRLTSPVRISSLCILLLSVVHNSHAADLFKKGPSVFNYNFAEVAYIDAGSADGFDLVGSGDIQQNIAIRVDFSSVESADGLRLGATYYIQSQTYPQADWNFSAGLDRVESEGGAFISAGTRYALNDLIELNATMQLTTIGDTDLSFHVAGLYEISPGFSAFAGTEIGGGSATRLGVRFYWR